MDAAYEMLNMHNEGCLTGQQLLRSLVGDRGATAFPKHGYVHEAREELRWEAEAKTCHQHYQHHNLIAVS